MYSYFALSKLGTPVDIYKFLQQNAEYPYEIVVSNVRHCYIFLKGVYTSVKLFF